MTSDAGRRRILKSLITASDYSKRKFSSTSSLSSDSPRPPDGVLRDNVEEGEEGINNPSIDDQTIKEGQDKESETPHADEYYEMGKEILQKNREGRRLWQAYENNAKRYVILVEECRKQERESPLLLPPRPHALYDRLRQIIPEQRSHPGQQAYLTGALQRNLEKDLDLTMWDEEHLDEYERIYLHEHREEITQDPPCEDKTQNSPEVEEPAQQAIEFSNEQPSPETAQEQISGDQNISEGRTIEREDMFRGMFESAEKLPQTPAAQMSAAFNELETLMEEAVQRRLSLPNITLPQISSTPTVIPMEDCWPAQHRHT